MTEIEPEEILNIASTAGRLVLESGGETYRTEDTIVSIARSMGAKKASAFVTPTVIIVTGTDENNCNHSAMERIRNRSVNLKRIAQVNSLSRKLASRETPSNPVQVGQLLAQIEAASTYPSWFIILASGFCSLFNIVLYKGTWQEAAISFVISMLIRLFLLYIGRFTIPSFLVSLLAGVFISVLSEFSAFIGLAAGSGRVTSAVLIMVVPGLATVNAVRDIIAGDLVSGNARLTDAFMTAAGLSVGTAFGVLLLPF
ncbi:MAG: threonine/serine exporter family protein [Spirochaetaceae bacterium]|jgi:uncharacterized membrane protein YjjP (DUF1212 family)|nr:threonine/serine exporter family protein [Spirochaetaceae bacterium]